MGKSIARSWLLLDVALVALGFYTGWALSHLDHFLGYKLYAIVGIAFDIVGVLFLTYLVLAGARIKEWIAQTFALLSVKAFIYLPWGLLFGAFVALAYNDAPSAMDVASFAFPIMFLTIIPIFTFEDVVLYRRYKRFDSPDSKVKFLGGFFLLTGLVVQFIGAVKDFAAT